MFSDGDLTLRTLKLWSTLEISGVLLEFADAEYQAFLSSTTATSRPTQPISKALVKVCPSLFTCLYSRFPFHCRRHRHLRDRPARHPIPQDLYLPAAIGPLQVRMHCLSPPTQQAYKSPSQACVLPI